MLKAINITRPGGRNHFSGPGFARIRELMIGQQLKTPFLVLSRSEIRKRITSLASVLPGVGIRYAVKANCHPAILEEVVRAGHGFDVASFREIQMGLEAGAHADEMVHSHPIKAPDEIEAAIRAGIRLFVIDNPDEIDKFAPYAGRVSLLIRLRINGSSAVVNLSYKFGCTPDEVVPLARHIRRRGLDYGGLTFHVGSQCLDNKIYVAAINSSADLITALEEHGFTTSLLDIGGGFPVPYTGEVPSIGKFCRPISRALTRHLDSRIRVICEPGRYISATGISLAASIIGRSVRNGRPWYFLDDGLYGSFSGRMYDHASYNILTNRNTTWKRSVLAGPTCDSVDVVYKDVLLPPMAIGDILIFPAMGAYCSVSASSFNGLRKAEYVVVE